MSNRRFIQPNRDEQLLFPPSIHDYVPKDSLAPWLVRLIDTMDLSAFRAEYDSPDNGGRPPYDPAMMLALIFYCMMRGELSCRAMERMTHIDLGARYITGNLHPDHNCIYRFPLRHGVALTELFTQLMVYCMELKLVKNEHWALDGTAIKANASRKYTIKVDDLQARLHKAQAVVAELLGKMRDLGDEEKQDSLEDQLRKAKRLQKKLQAAIEAGSKRKPVEKSDNGTAWTDPESELTREQAKEKQQEAGEKLREARKSQGLSQKELSSKADVAQSYLCNFELGWRSPNAEILGRLTAALDLPEGTLGPFLPKPLTKPTSEYINLTDLDACVIKKSSGFTLGYYAEAAADAGSRLVMSWSLCKSNDERPAFPAMIAQAEQIFGSLPPVVSADTGFSSTENYSLAEARNLNLLCPPKTGAGKKCDSNAELRDMVDKLSTEAAKTEYSKRSHTIEPVFSTIKDVFGMRQFRSRTHSRVSIEWLRTVIAYNLYKMHQALGALFGQFSSVLCSIFCMTLTSSARHDGHPTRPADLGFC